MPVSNIFKSVFPYTLETEAEYLLMDDNRIDKMIQDAHKAFKSWSKTSFSERAGIFKNVSFLLRRDLESLAVLITREMGKIISESRAEVEKCAAASEYYAEHAELFLADEKVMAGYTKSFISYEPIGVVLGIMPWNFPFWQVFRYAAPTLMAGNTTLLKHAPNVCGCALALEKIFLEAGAPVGVFTTMIIDTQSIEKILSSDLVQAVTLTGSEKAGSSVASIAGRFIKKTVLELGGSDALIVLPDAPMKQAVGVALNSRMLNAGQSCIAAKRFIVVKKALDDFLNECMIQIRELKQGDPFDQYNSMGPMARTDLVNSLKVQMEKSVEMGAEILYGGYAGGCNFKPTLLFNVKNGMPAFDEETFGPLAAVIVAEDEEGAIQLANMTGYGLSGSVWTSDTDKGIAIARKIRTGSVFINTLVKSDPRLPFGGIKKSGFGRELGRQGILEFVNLKTIAAEDVK